MIKEIPNGWKCNKLKEIGKFTKGSGIPGYSYVDCGVPCIGYGDIYTTYNIQFNKSVHFTDSETARSGKVAKKGTLMFTGSGETAEEIGKCVCYTGDELLYAGGDIIMYNTDKVNPVFLAYQQNVWAFIREKARFGQGHSVVHIHESELGDLNCLYPKERTEQDKIVEILDVWAKAVEFQEQKVEKLKEKKKALMQKLLTIKGEAFSIQDLLDKNYCRLIKPKELGRFDGEKTYLSTSSIINDEIISNEGQVTYNDRPSRAQMKPLENSVWFAKMENSVKVYKFNKNEEDKYILSTGFYGFLSNEEKLSSDFLKQIFLSYNFNAQKDIFAEGSSQNGIKDDHLSDILVNIPSLDNQKRIANILRFNDLIIIKEKALLYQYKEQQKALMQKLLTGEIRV